MSILSTKPAIAIAMLLGLSAVFSANASTTMTNPVTGADETYTYKFVGTTDTWNGAQYWQDSDGATPTAVPGVTGSNLWDPILFDASVNSININAGAAVEGWNLRMGLYNGAKVKLNNLQKLQGNNTPMWITVDGISQCTIGHMVNAKLVNSSPLSLYSAKTGGIAWSEALSDSSNGDGSSMPFHYYLTGTGSVAFNAGISVTGNGAHVIKQADVTLTGTSQVSSKTLVSFTSSTKTFTADAAIKVYDTDGTTLATTVNLATVNTTGSTTLTTSDPVGTVELVQTSTGVVLYYVDGDPADVNVGEKTYKPSISVNFTSGTALSTAGDVGLAGYAVPGPSWNNLTVVNNATLSPLNKIDSTGAATASSASVTITNTRGEWHCSSLVATSDMRAGYIDETADVTTPTVTVSGIPYDQYKVVVYTATDAANVKFGYVTINGTNYTYSDGAVAEGTTAWGASGAQDTAEALAEGVNVLVSPVVSGGTLTVVGHRSGTNPRGCIAAVQIVKVEQELEEGDLLIELEGDKTYSFDSAGQYNTVYVTGEGTVTFAGTASIATTLHIGPSAAVNMNGSTLTPSAVTGNGTAIYTGATPATGLGWTDSANWTGTLWVKNHSSFSGVVPNTMANAKSTLRLSGVVGYFNNGDSKQTCDGTLELENDSSSYAFSIDNGYSTYGITVFAKLKGSGTLGVQSRDIAQRYVFKDASEFTGTFSLAGRPLRVILGNGETLSPDNGTITIVSGATATVASGATWTANQNGFRVEGTLNVNGTLASSASAAIKGSGTVVFTGRAPTPTGDTWWKNSNWTGTVQMKSVTLVGTDLAFNDYGNTGSVLELNGCSGWLTPAYTCTVPLKITGTLTLNNGYSGKSNAFKVGTLLGDGTISGSDAAPTMVFNVTDDCSNFTGKVQLTNKCVVFGSSIPDSLTEGRIYIAEGAQVTVQNTAEAGWWAVGGIQVDGELRANSLARFGGGTNITTSDNGVFTLVSNSNTDDMNVDYTRIKGTGTLKYEGTNYRTISTNNFPTALVVENNLSQGLIHRNNGQTVSIGSLSGSGQMRSDWDGSGNTGDRDLRILQAKDTTYSGLFASSNDRIDEVYVAPGASTAGTLTLSGTQTASNGLIVESGAKVNLTGTWKGNTTVSGTFGGTGTLTGNLTFSDGAKFKVFDAAGDGTADTDADGLNVSGAVTVGDSGTVTVTIADGASIASETVILTATSIDGTFELASSLADDYELITTTTTLTIRPIIYASDGETVAGYMDGTTAVITNTAAAAAVPASTAAIQVYPTSNSASLIMTLAQAEALLQGNMSIYATYKVGGVTYRQDITSAFTPSTVFGENVTVTVTLSGSDVGIPNTVVVDEETITVTPALDTSTTPIAAGTSTASFTVKTIPGLYYAVGYGSDNSTFKAQSDAVVQATSTTTTLTAPTGDFSGIRYYKIQVGVSSTDFEVYPTESE